MRRVRRERCHVMLRIYLHGVIGIAAKGQREESWEATVHVNERELFRGRHIRRFDVDRQVTGYGSTPTGAIAHARKTMREARYERAHPKSWDVGVRYSPGQIVELARSAHAPGSGYPEWRAEQREKRSKPGVGPCENCGTEGPLYRRPRGTLHLCKECAESLPR